MNRWIPDDVVKQQQRAMNEQAAFFGLDRSAPSTFLTRPAPKLSVWQRFKNWLITKLGGEPPC